MKKNTCSLLLLLALTNTSYSQKQSQTFPLLVALENAKTSIDSLNAYISFFESCGYEDCIKYAASALKFADKIPLENVGKSEKKSIVEKKYLLYRNLDYMYQIPLDSSSLLLEYCKHGLANSEEIGDTTQIIYFKLQLGSRYLLEDNFPNSLKYCQSALSIAKIFQHDNLLADCLNQMTWIYEKAGDVPQALVNTKKTLEFYKVMKDTIGIAGRLVKMGILYGKLHQKELAIASFNRAIGFYEIINNKEGLRLTYNAMGFMFRNNNDTINELDSFKKSLLLSEQLPDKTFIRANLGNIGDIYRKKGDLQQALNYHYKALKIAKEINLYEGQISWVWFQLAQDYLKLKNYKKAKKYIELNLNEALKEKLYISSLSEAELLAAQIDSASGNFKEAFIHYQQFIYWRDKLNSEEVKKAAIKEKFQTDYEEQKAKDKALQEKKDVLIQQQLQKQKIIRNSFIAGSVLLIFLVIVLINRNKLKRTVEIEKIRSRLSRDLHDDIGSTLSSINILSRTAQTSLQTNHDEKTKVSLEKINERSQRLLDNMSDIIWNINPGNDTIEEVMSRMREYATTILEAKNIDYTFNFPQERIDCKLTMEVKNNMYLIFKEAVNNLSKYSDASIATLSLTFDDKHLHLKIEDNGKGFNNDEITHRGGIINMQLRAAEIKGDFTIESVFDKGTRIALTLPRYC